MTDPDLCFILLSSCVPVRGFRRSTICDLQRQAISFIPNDLYDILIKDKGKTFAELIGIYGKENADTLESYFELLIEKEYGFWGTSAEANFFPPLPLDFESRHFVDNAIVDIDSTSEHDFELIFRAFENLGNVDIQLRVFGPADLVRLRCISDLSMSFRINSIQIICGYNPARPINEWRKLLASNTKIVLLVLHSAPENKTYDEVTPIIFLKSEINSSDHCGLIGAEFFAVNVPFFVEAHSKNTCLYGKISIDVKGQVRNCPSCAQSFGNYKDVVFEDLIKNEKFNRLWNVRKDEIKVCKDCEFRYVCSDCRAFVENPSDEHSKPLKCGYSPYTNEWQDWSKNPLNSVAKSFYGFQD